MAKYLPTLRTELARLIKDKDGYLESTDLDDALARAARVLSKKTPYVAIRDETGDGTNFAWDLQTDFFTGFSTVIDVFYPFDSETQTPALPLEPFEWEVIHKSTGVYRLLLKSATPATGETLRYYYTTTHTVDETSSTIYSAEDEDSVTYYAAALCLKRMAARAISVRNPTINADTVDYQSRSREYSDLAKMYEEMSGLSGYQNSAQMGAIVYVDYDPTTPEGENQLTHFRDWR